MMRLRIYPAALAYAAYCADLDYKFLPEGLRVWLYRRHLSPLRLMYRLTGQRISGYSIYTDDKASKMRMLVRKLAREKGWAKPGY